MSEKGQKRRFDPLPAVSGLPRTTDIIRPTRLVRFVPIGDESSRRSARPSYPLADLNAGLQEEPNCTSAMAFLQGDCGNGRGAIAKVDVQRAQPSPVRSMPEHS